MSKINATVAVDNTEKEKSIKPAARGSLLCFCRGEVLAMLSHCGWLMVYGDIDNPSVEKHGGDVYIHQDNVIGSERLCRGDSVTFYLYMDDKGLGAEKCCLEQRAASPFNPDAPEFVPRNSKPTPKGTWAEVFPRMANVFKDTTFDEDDECYDFIDVGKPWQTTCSQSSDGSTHDGATSVSEEDNSSGKAGDSEREDVVIEKGLPPVKPLPQNFRPDPALSLPPWRSKNGLGFNDMLSNEVDVSYDVIVDKPWQAKRAPSSDGSTHDGATSDSEEEISSGTGGDSEEEGAALEKGLPPMKPLPPNFRPPPGLSLPPWRRTDWSCFAGAS